MTTFSQLVDSMKVETRRMDLQPEIVSYANQTLREMHMEPSRGNVVMFRDNLKEQQLTANSDLSLTWEFPRPALYQAVAAVRYDSVIDRDGEPVWAKEFTSPNRNMNHEKHWFYQVGQSLAFSGFGGVNARVSISWYEYTASLRYYPVEERPATLSLDGTWSYLPAYDIDNLTRASARALVTNWLLMRWQLVVEEGIRAKVYKRLSDTERARTSYSMYQQLRQGVITGERGLAHGA